MQRRSSASTLFGRIAAPSRVAHFVRGPCSHKCDRHTRCKGTSSRPKNAEPRRGTTPRSTDDRHIYPGDGLLAVDGPGAARAAAVLDTSSAPMKAKISTNKGSSSKADSAAPIRLRSLR